MVCRMNMPLRKRIMKDNMQPIRQNVSYRARGVWPDQVHGLNNISNNIPTDKTLNKLLSTGLSKTLV